MLDMWRILSGVLFRSQQAKPTKKEKTAKEKTKPSEVVSHNGNVVDDRGKVSADATKHERPRDAVHGNGTPTSELTEDKGEFRVHVRSAGKLLGSVVFQPRLRWI